MKARILLLAAVTAFAAQAANYLVYIGTYTNPKTKSEGIYAYRFDTATGKLTALGLAAETASPSFVGIHPNGRYLYSVSETGGRDGEKGGGVSAFEIDRATGKLKHLNTVSSRGAGPCYVRTDHKGNVLFVANYGGGSVAAMPIKKDGSLGEAVGFQQHTGSGADPRRQRGPHAHSINPSPDNKYVMAADLGLDKILIYKFGADASLTPNDPPYAEVPPKGGPRHFDFHPNGKFAYAINEMGNTITAFGYDGKTGALRPLETVDTLPKDFTATSHTAEVQVHPSGKFVYGSNRGHDSISVFRVDPNKGTLSLIEQTPTQGRTPRNFGIDPGGMYLIAANQATNNLVVFRIDQNTGKLTPTGETAEVGSPVCVKFLKL
jgi:6-phosphogluconolactonase